MQKASGPVNNDLRERLVALARERISRRNPEDRRVILLDHAGERYVCKLWHESWLAEQLRRFSAWRKRLNDRDVTAYALSRRERVRRLHRVVATWREKGFGHQCPEVVTGLSDDLVIYREVKGPTLYQAVGTGAFDEQTGALLAALSRILARHEAARGEAEDTARLLVHADPHPHNIILADHGPVFIDLEDAPHPRAGLLAAMGRELGCFVYRGLRWIQREEVPAACALLVKAYPHRDVWSEAVRQLALTRRLELSGFRRRRRLNIQRQELAAVLRSRLPA